MLGFLRQSQVGGISALEDGILAEVVVYYVNPSSVAEVRIFAEPVNYYNDFIPQFADPAKPLHALIKRNTRFACDQSCEDVFNQLKIVPMEPPILTFPDWNWEFRLTTDASDKEDTSP